MGKNDNKTQTLRSSTSMEPGNSLGGGEEGFGQWIYAFPPEKDFVDSIKRVFESPEILDWSESHEEKEIKETLNKLINLFEDKDITKVGKSLYYLSKRSLEHSFPVILNPAPHPMITSLGRIESFLESQAWKTLKKPHKYLLLTGISGQKIEVKDNFNVVLLIVITLIVLMVFMGGVIWYLSKNNQLQGDTVKFILTAVISGTIGASLLALIRKIGD